MVVQMVQNSTMKFFHATYHIFMQHFIFACSVFIFSCNISYFHATFHICMQRFHIFIQHFIFSFKTVFFHAATIFDIILHLVCKVNYIAVVHESLYVQSEYKTLMQYKNCLINNENIFLL